MTSSSTAVPALAYSQDGDPAGPAVIMGSSLGTTRDMWAPNVAALADFNVIRFDHLGHGESPVPDGPYTIDQLGDAVLQLLDSLEITRAAYVGLSLGGAIGQWLAINAPERLTSLSLLCTAATFPTPESWRERAALVRRDGSSAVAEMAMGRWFTEAFRAAHPEQIKQWVAMVGATPAEGYAGCCEALATYDVRDLLSAVTTPTLAIAGAQDPSTPPEALKDITDRIPGSRLEIVDQAAHLANVEQADTVNTILLGHLRGDSP